MIIDHVGDPAPTNAVNTAEREDFRVGDDYSVTDTWTYYSSAAEQVQRETAAERHSSFIKSRAANLVNNEQEIARQLSTATAGLHSFGFGEDGADGGPGGNGQPRVVLVDDVRRDPTIQGPASTAEREQDGYDLIRQIRRLKSPLATIPAVALTAFARSEDRRRALMAGFQVHVAKPVEPAELTATAASLVGRTGI